MADNLLLLQTLHVKAIKNLFWQTIPCTQRQIDSDLGRKLAKNRHRVCIKENTQEQSGHFSQDSELEILAEKQSCLEKALHRFLIKSTDEGKGSLFF